MAEPGYGLDEMIEEAWIAGASRYTVSDYNLSRVADLAAADWAEKHPELKGFQAFIAGALYERYRSVMRDLSQKKGNSDEA